MVGAGLVYVPDRAGLWSQSQLRLALEDPDCGTVILLVSRVEQASPR